MKKVTLKDKLKSFPKSSFIITIIVIIILLMMGTGYALSEQILDFFGTSKIELADYKIYISDIKLLSATNGGYVSSDPTFSDSSIGTYSTLTNEESSVVYEITIKNVGESDAILDYLYASTDNPNIKYKIIGTSATSVIKGQSVNKIKIAVENSENISDYNNTASLLINFEFIKKTDDYSNECTLSWDGSSSNEPSITDISGTSYYQITNANEFKWFADQINNGNTTINGILTNNICLNDNDFEPIGENNPYTGILDGQNRTIKGISYSRDSSINSETTYNKALFINNNGTIKNLNVVGNNSDTNKVTGTNSYSNIAGITVNNNGIIENCSFKGNISIDTEARVNCSIAQSHSTSLAGGIATVNNGIIRGCYNNANITIKGNLTYGVCNLYTRDVNIHAGGIVGDNAGYIVDCYNNANMDSSNEMKSTTRSEYNGILGGITGNNSNVCINGYNSGMLTQNLTSNNTGNSQTGVIGENSGNITNITNIYYVSGTVTNNIGTSVSTNDLITLNLNIGNGFLIDYKNINNGYPTLWWE